MAFPEDLDLFFNTNEFAVAATYNSSTVNVIFDNAFLENNAGIESTVPTCIGKTSDFTGVTPGTSTIVISSITYVIQNIQPDGTGLSTLILEEQ